MTRYANAQTIYQFDPSQYISKKHYKLKKKGGAKKATKQLHIWYL